MASTAGGASAVLAACASAVGAAETRAPETRAAETRAAETRAAETRPPSAAQWSALAASLKGTLIRPSDPRYPVAVQLFDFRYDGIRPAAVAYGADASDVARCVDFARRHGLTPIPRSGGHSYAGYSTGRGLVIDVSSISAMRTGTLPGGLPTATIGAGARLIDVYSGLATSGVSIPGGSCATVGIAGLALGGGVGVVGRRYGLTSDRLVSAQVVTADGRVVTADATTNADLYWACRGGGGGNFGIVTSFTFSTFLTADVTIFSLDWPWEAASQVLPAWLAWAPAAPDPLWSNLVLQTHPTDPAPRVTVGGVWQGDDAGLAPLLAGLLSSAGSPTDRNIETVPFAHAMFVEAGCAGLSQASCRLATESLSGPTVLAGPSGPGPVGTLPREPSLAKSDYLDAALGDAGVAAVLAGIDGRRAAGGDGAVGYDAYGGALNRVAADATAFVHRGSLASAQYGVPFTPSTSAAALAAGQTWLDTWYQSLRPYVSGAAYQNYIDPHLESWAKAYYGSNLARLERIKARWDPDRTFHFPQAIGTA